MKTLLCALLLSVLALTATNATPDIWTVIGVDPSGDAVDSMLGDAAQLAYKYDAEHDEVWLRIALWSRPSSDTLSVTITIDPDGDNRKVVSTARVDDEAVKIRITRADFGSKTQMRVVASIGSEQSRNDVVPNAQAAMIDLSASRPTRGLSQIDLNRNNLRFSAGERTLALDARASFTTFGTGSQPMILVPGVYSGQHAFDAFIKRNASSYKFYVMTPPGLNGTTPRPLPAETVTYGDFTWTRALERDILHVITTNTLTRPIIVAHGFPGSLAAHDIAANDPSAIGGVIDIASIAVQPAPSFKDPRVPSTPEERIATVDTAWTRKWFKYVTPETWVSANYPAAMLSNDPQAGEAARTQLEAAPLEVKIRYLAEFMASDQSALLKGTTVPMLVLRPGFDDKTLGDPANGFFKMFLLDSWEPFITHPHIRIMTIPNARALLLDDQPKVADDAIAAFVAGRR